MPSPDEPSTLTDLIDRLERAGDGDPTITLEEVVEATGRRSFGPLLLLAGLVALSPLSGIPGMPSAMAVLVLLIAGQLICRRRYFWLPHWLLARSVSRRRFHKGLRWMRRPAGGVDRLLRPRLHLFVSNVGFMVILTLCVMVALTMPVMEPLPFAATTAGAALTGFGLALIAHDGLVALLAMIATIAGGWFLIATLF